MPAPKSPSDDGFNRFDFRVGVHNFPNWGGVSQEGSSACPMANQLRAGTNIRPFNSGYKARGGQSRAVDTIATGKLDGVFDAGDIGA